MKIDGEAHMVAMDNAKHLADAASQAARQSISTRAALIKSRQEELAMRERENIRMQKEAEAKKKKEESDKKKQAEKELKKKEKEELKVKKKAEKAAKKQAEQEQQDDDAEGAEGDKKRRRGRGAEELHEGEDPPCLTNRFVDFEAPTFDSLDSFLHAVIQGVPSLWKARRTPMKKVIEIAGLVDDKKTLNNVSVLLQSEWRSFLSTFAAEVEGNPELNKRCKACPRELQTHMESLAMDPLIQEFLEDQTTNPNVEYQVDPALVMERAVLGDKIKETLDVAKGKGLSDHAKAMESELALYNNLHLVGVPKGKVFAGIFSGLYPHVVYQMEGTRAIALARASDVSWLNFM